MPLLITCLLLLVSPGIQGHALCTMLMQCIMLAHTACTCKNPAQAHVHGLFGYHRGIIK